ncbi:glycerophosphodiester phosphodiesterase family protein [Pontixanthobacter luteolus]|uniref:glycerophosphodiester phosphodiesterase family protein n=1 Tax=Pontixanthobacter luteolus TaxID=295089 RepID=UPI002303BB9D|nr:glycerophosphodiester phosphodiesterase family protein [Pontixanthobacter luteolus]
MRSLLFRLLDNWRAPAPDAGKIAWIKEWEFAHRGLHAPGVPENSSGAFADAIRRGMGIECDIQRSRDGRAMVFHDWDLDRLTDLSGPVAKLDAAQLEEVRLSGSNDAIQSLPRFLDQVGGQVPVLIELKSAYDRRINSLCMEVHRALEGYQGKYGVMSFDPRVSRWFSAHAPRTVRGLVLKDRDFRGPLGPAKRRLAMWHARPDFLACDVRDLPSAFIAAQRGRGVPVASWTVKTAELRTVALENVDALISEGEGLV